MSVLITHEMWENFTHNLFIPKSTEAIGDAFEDSPPGGDAEGDSDSDFGNEQNNEGDFGGDMDMGGMDDFGGDDMGGDGMGDDMSGGGSGGLGTDLKPTDNPFKGQNGRSLLDTKLAELYSSVENSLKLIQCNAKIDKVVVNEFSSLLESIRQVREVVFIQPIESSLYRWALCVHAYELITKTLCNDIKELKKQND
jgi:hypothetical protein